MTKKQKEVQEAVTILKEWGLKEGTTVYANITHVSQSGMSRRVQLFIRNDDGIINISYWAAKAMEWKYTEGYNKGISVSGCGMDMLLHTVYTLSYAMGYGELAQTNDNKKGLKYKQL